MLAILVWIGANSDFNTKVPLPRVEFVSPEELQERSGLKGINVAALYDDDTKVMYFKIGFDAASTEDSAYLTHELVHHVQFENKIGYRTCSAVYEKEAYRITNLWFVSHGLSEPYSKEDIVLWSVCPAEKD